MELSNFDGDMEKTMSFYEQMKMVQQIVQDQLEKGKDKYMYNMGSVITPKFL